MSDKWIKSTYSTWENCIEVSRNERGVMIRDSKFTVSGAVIVTVSAAAWRYFTAHATTSAR
ncbi:DUF397 domain-containing protein [Streptomyces collinus]|uniref:DUF397 domain-containing protein n=1 Tax=Streptomyces collinus TaxID=42684 RepID=UPI00378C134B